MLTFVNTAIGLHEWPQSTGTCVAPGTCTPPDAKYSRVMLGPVPGQQWNIAGGFCGSFSTQHAALAKGAWISQDLVRKANADQPIKQPGHGDKSLGYEILPVNVGYSAEHLGLTYEEWDYNSPTPQASAYKAWLKKHLAAGNAIVWFPMCKGDSHTPYAGSCPNGGHLDHVEAMYAIYSNHPLDDPKVYDDDVIVHTSDQDYMPCATPPEQAPSMRSLSQPYVARGMAPTRSHATGITAPSTRSRIRPPWKATARTRAPASATTKCAT